MLNSNNLSKKNVPYKSILHQTCFQIVNITAEQNTIIVSEHGHYKISFSNNDANLCLVTKKNKLLKKVNDLVIGLCEMPCFMVIIRPCQQRAVVVCANEKELNLESLFFYTKLNLINIITAAAQVLAFRHYDAEIMFEQFGRYVFNKKKNFKYLPLKQN